MCLCQILGESTGLGTESISSLSGSLTQEKWDWA